MMWLSIRFHASNLSRYCRLQLYGLVEHKVEGDGNCQVSHGITVACRHTLFSRVDYEFILLFTKLLFITELKQNSCAAELIDK